MIFVADFWLLSVNDSLSQEEEKAHHSVDVYVKPARASEDAYY